MNWGVRNRRAGSTNDLQAAHQASALIDPPTTVRLSTIKRGRGTQPDDAAATDRNGMVLTLGSMEVIAVSQDWFRTHEGGPVGPSARKTTGGEV